MIEPASGQPGAYQCSKYAEILEWLINATPGQWMRVPPVDAAASARMDKAVRYHLKPRGIRATIRRTPGFTYIGRK